MKPRLFWTRARVRRVNGTDEQWYIDAKASRGPFAGCWNIEVDISSVPIGIAADQALSQLRGRYHCQINMDEALPFGRNWVVDSGMSVTQDDGYNFPTLGQAVFKFMEKSFENALDKTRAMYELSHLVSGNRIHERPHAISRGQFSEPIYQVVSYAEPIHKDDPHRYSKLLKRS